MSAQYLSDEVFMPFDRIIAGSSSTLDPSKGLPEDEARLAMAQTYLELQYQLWPELVKSGQVVVPAEELVIQYAERFRSNFVSGSIQLFSLPATLRLMLACAYVRYSCENSNPRSLAQQLRNILEYARTQDYFIPWQYVFADAAVTGTTSERNGYQYCKQVFRNPLAGVECLIVDEIGRANRNTVEAMMLGRIVEYFKKRMVGVKDSYDSRSAMSTFQLGLFAAMQELFVHQLREKVKRGRNDAFRLGRNIGPVPLVQCFKNK